MILPPISLLIYHYCVSLTHTIPSFLIQRQLSCLKCTLKKIPISGTFCSGPAVVQNEPARRRGSPFVWDCLISLFLTLSQTKLAVSGTDPVVIYEGSSLFIPVTRIYGMCCLYQHSCHPPPPPAGDKTNNAPSRRETSIPDWGRFMTLTKS